jgi:hypothetical protein
MIISELKKNYLAKIVAAAVFSALVYCFGLLKINDFNEAVKLIQIGLPQVKKEFFTLRFLESVPFLPVFIIWFFIGSVLYFFYYSISLVYSDLSNRIIVKTSYTNIDSDVKEFNISKIKRIFLHFIIVVYYLFGLIVTFFFTIPASQLFQLWTEGIFSPISEPYPLIVSLIASFFLWLFMLNLFTFFLDFIFSLILKERIKEEHFAINTEK